MVDMWKRYGAPDSEPPHGSTFNSTKECLEVIAVQEALEVIPNCSCKRACEETAYTGWYIPFDSNDEEEAVWYLDLFIENPVTKIELFPDFPLEQYLGAFGGVIGLSGKLQFVFHLFAFQLYSLWAVSR